VLLAVLFGYAAVVCYGFAVGAERKEDAGRNASEPRAPAPEIENWLRSKANWPNCGVHRDSETGAVTTWKPGDGIDVPGGPQAKAQIAYLKAELAAHRAQEDRKVALWYFDDWIERCRRSGDVIDPPTDAERIEAAELMAVEGWWPENALAEVRARRRERK
jgi:hypothetical protein